jgi:hypothetical protein
LRIPFQIEKELISDSNCSKTYKEECSLRGLLLNQEEAAQESLEEAARRNFEPGIIVVNICRIY